jgi:hypothetical protein
MSLALLKKVAGAPIFLSTPNDAPTLTHSEYPAIVTLCPLFSSPLVSLCALLHDLIKVGTCPTVVADGGKASFVPWRHAHIDIWTGSTEHAAQRLHSITANAQERGSPFEPLAPRISTTGIGQAKGPYRRPLISSFGETESKKKLLEDSISSPSVRYGAVWPNDDHETRFPPPQRDVAFLADEDRIIAMIISGSTITTTTCFVNQGRAIDAIRSRAKKPEFTDILSSTSFALTTFLRSDAFSSRFTEQTISVWSAAD